MKKTATLICIFVLSNWSFSGAANLDPSLRFSTIKTEHFYVHYHQGLEGMAKRAAVIAEEVHDKLTKKFLWQPQEKTQLVLIDDSDFTNGFASVLPYNTIYVQVVPPYPDSTIGEYEDWLMMVIAHEYAHILTMDPWRGYSETTRKIFGKSVPGENPFTLIGFIATAPPNVFLPRWWHEGMATWAETEINNGGRGKSTYYEMILRSAVAEGNIPSIDKINGDIPYWPAGSTPYIFGLRLQKFIADKYGSGLPGKLNMKHAGRFPYFLNGAPEQLLKGWTYATLYYDMVHDLKNKQKRQIDTLKKRPFTDFKVLHIHGERLTNPRFSPDGKLIAFNKRDPHGHETIMIANSDGTNAADILRRLPSDRGVSWSPDGAMIYFSQAETTDGFNLYQDLYAYDIKSKTIRRLTEGFRVREPDVSPDGSSIAAVVVERGSTHLALIRNSAIPVKLTNYGFMRVSSPRWSPDGASIAYCVKDNAGNNSLYILDVKNGSHNKLFETRFNIAYPVWSKDGKNIIYTADDTGVYNLFAISVADGRRFQVSHLLGGAFQPDISPDGSKIVFSSYDSKGFKIAVMNYSSENWESEPGPVIKPYWNENTDTDTDTDTVNVTSFKGGSERTELTVYGPEKQSKADLRFNSTPYSAYETLKPRFWLPTLSGDHEGAVLGAFTAGQDVLGYNTYIAEVDAGLSSGNLYYRAAYLNDYLYPTFKLSAYSQPFLYSNFLLRGDYWERNEGFEMAVSVPITRVESRYLFSAGYKAQKQESLSKLVAGKFNGLPVFEGYKNNLFFGFEFFNNIRYPYSISSEEGRSLNLYHRYYSRSAGSDKHSKEYTASYKEYFLIPLENHKHHVLYLSFNGGVSSGETTVQQAFQLGGAPSPELTFPLRGYPLRFETGKYIATGTLEYRAPLRYVFSGTDTKPLFVEKMHMAAFIDSGEVWDETRKFSSDRLKTGTGVELRFDVTLGYWLKITPTLGIARGLNQNGETQIYFTIYTNL